LLHNISIFLFTFFKMQGSWNTS